MLDHKKKDMTTKEELEKEIKNKMNFNFNFEQKQMIKSKSEKQTITLTCTNGVTAVILGSFKKVKTFYKGRQIEEFKSDDVSVSELCNKINGYLIEKK